MKKVSEESVVNAAADVLRKRRLSLCMLPVRSHPPAVDETEQRGHQQDAYRQ